jgi:hypothetical protein
MNNNNIVIIRRQDEQPEPLNDQSLQRDAEELEIETSSTVRMFAVVLLAFAVAGALVTGGMILRLLW